MLECPDDWFRLDEWFIYLEFIIDSLKEQYKLELAAVGCVLFMAIIVVLSLFIVQI